MHKAKEKARKEFSLGAALNEGSSIIWGKGAGVPVLVTGLAMLVFLFISDRPLTTSPIMNYAIEILVSALGAAIYAPIVVKHISHLLFDESVLARLPHMSVDATFGALFWANAIVTALVLFGTLLLIIPGLIVYSLLFFTSIVIVLERGTAFEGIERSLALGRGVRLEVFFIAAIVLAVILVADLILSVILAGSGTAQLLLRTIAYAFGTYWSFGVGLAAYSRLVDEAGFGETLVAE